MRKMLAIKSLDANNDIMNKAKDKTAKGNPTQNIALVFVIGIPRLLTLIPLVKLMMICKFPFAQNFGKQIIWSNSWINVMKISDIELKETVNNRSVIEDRFSPKMS